MSDRLVISLATIPMLSGVLLLGLLQRPEAAGARGARDLSEHAGQSSDKQPSPAKTWVGVVTAGNDAQLGAEFDGRITKIWLKSGAVLKEGEPILEIDRADIATTVGVAGAELGQKRSDVMRAQARLEAAQTRLVRLEQGGKWLSAQELDLARTEARVAHAELSAARSFVKMGQARLAQQQLRAQKHTIVAPFSGTLVSVDVDRGDTVAEGQVLARVISHERLIRFALSRQELTEEPFVDVLVRLKGQRDGLRTQVLAVRPEVDAAAQLVFATAALPPQAATLPSWMPGSVVEVLSTNSEQTLSLGGR